MILGAVVLTAWAGAWITLSGKGAESVRWLRQTYYKGSAAEGFTVNNVLVQGRVNVDPAMLRAAININRGDPILAADPADIREMIERISWVKEAHVERRLPDTLFIGLIERKPLALWQHKGKIRLIDDEGVTLADKNLDKFSDLLIIVGDDAPLHAAELVGILEAEPTVRSHVEAATWVGGRRWDLKIKSGATVKLPEDDAGLALRRLAEAQAHENILLKDIESIDLREPERFVIRARPGAAQAEVQAGSTASATVEPAAGERH